MHMKAIKTSSAPKPAIKGRRDRDLCQRVSRGPAGGLTICPLIASRLFLRSLDVVKNKRTYPLPDALRSKRERCRFVLRFADFLVQHIDEREYQRHHNRTNKQANKSKLLHAADKRE